MMRKMLLAVLALPSCVADSGLHHRDEGLAHLVLEKHYEGKLPKSGRDIELSSAWVDLDDDGSDEAILHVSDDLTCGSGGCDTFILTRADQGYRIVTKLTISWPPIRVFESKTNGWRDLGVLVRGGGIQPGYEAVLKFNGTSYPSNPSLVPPSDQAAEGRALITASTPTTPLRGGE